MHNYFNVFLFSKAQYERVHHECIKCLKAIMNNKVGLQKLFSHDEALILLARFCSTFSINTIT